MEFLKAEAGAADSFPVLTEANILPPVGGFQTGKRFFPGAGCPLRIRLSLECPKKWPFSQMANHAFAIGATFHRSAVSHFIYTGGQGARPSGILHL